MRKPVVALSALVCLVAVMSVVGCTESSPKPSETMKKTGDAMNDAAKETGEAMQDAADAAAKKMEESGH